MKTKAIIIDDVLLYRKDFSKRIKRCYPFDEVAELKSYAELVKLDTTGYNLFGLFDISLNEFNKKNKDGLKCIEYIKRVQENSFVASYSGVAAFEKQAMAKGSNIFLEKDVTLEDQQFDNLETKIKKHFNMLKKKEMGYSLQKEIMAKVVSVSDEEKTMNLECLYKGFRFRQNYSIDGLTKFRPIVDMHLTVAIYTNSESSHLIEFNEDRLDEDPFKVFDYPHKNVSHLLTSRAFNPDARYDHDKS